MRYNEVSLNQPLSLNFKDVQITIGIVSTLLTSSVQPQIVESNKQILSEYFISSGNIGNAVINNSAVLKASNSSTFELDSFGIKMVEMAIPEITYSYMIAERFIKLEENTVSVPEEGISMYEKLLTHRTNTENYGFAIGSILGIITMLIPIFSEVQFLAAIPAALIFLSVPAAVSFLRNFAKEDKV